MKDSKPVTNCLASGCNGCIFECLRTDLEGHFGSRLGLECEQQPLLLKIGQDSGKTLVLPPDPVFHRNFAIGEEEFGRVRSMPSQLFTAFGSLEAWRVGLDYQQADSASSRPAGPRGSRW